MDIDKVNSKMRTRRLSVKNSEETLDDVVILKDVPQSATILSSDGKASVSKSVDVHDICTLGAGIVDVNERDGVLSREVYPLRDRQKPTENSWGEYQEC
jgi:hypothetical protein